MVQELIPFIELDFRISSDRAIAGASLSGLFSLYALFEQSETFQRYFIGSPLISWDEPFMYGLERDFSDQHDDLPVRIYMCVSSLESEKYINNMHKMADLLRSRNYPGLVIRDLSLRRRNPRIYLSGFVKQRLEDDIWGGRAVGPSTSLRAGDRQ